MKDTSSPDYQIIDVWNNNLEGEFRKIRKIIQDYKYVAMVRPIDLKVSIHYLKFEYFLIFWKKGHGVPRCCRKNWGRFQDDRLSISESKVQCGFAKNYSARIHVHE
jgi:hypothetical protein